MSNFKNTATEFAAMSGSAKSPNLPFGTWDFVASTDADSVLVTTETSKNNNDYSFCEVVASGMNPDEAATVRRRVYSGAMGSNSPVLFDKTSGALKKTFTGGIFSGPNRTTVVSDKADVVAKGIGAANAAYSAERKAKEDAEKAAELVGG